MDPWHLGFVIGIYSITLLVVALTYRSEGFYWAMVPLVFAAYFLISESAAIASGNYFYANLPLNIDLAGLFAASARPPQPHACIQPSLAVPLSVVLMEGLIVFGLVRTTDFLAPPERMRPFMDGLMAVTIDLALDPIVANSLWCGAGSGPGDPVHGGVGLWTWFTHESNPPQWLGIPLVNFSAWFFGVVAISASVRLVASKMNVKSLDVWQQAISAVGAMVIVIVLGLVAEMASFRVMDELLGGVSVSRGQRWAILIGILGVTGLAIVAASRHFEHGHRFCWEVVVLPAFLFAYMGLALLARGPWSDWTLLASAWLLCALAYFAYARAPYLRRAWHERVRGKERGR
jgi:hypothetical protein